MQLFNNNIYHPIKKQCIFAFNNTRLASRRSAHLGGFSIFINGHFLHRNIIQYSTFFAMPETTILQLS